MLTLTEAARSHLAGILDNRDYADGVAVRFTHRDSEVSIALDNRTLGDSTFEDQGRTVLLLDQNAAEYLASETVDVEQADNGGKLFLSKKDAGSA